MKKLKVILAFLLVLSCLSMFACENSTQLRTATISEITSVGSDNYGVRITFLNDKRLEDKSVDVQVKFNKTGKITFWEENQDKLTFNIEEIDEWYSLTSLIANAKNEPNTESFDEHNKAFTKTYLWNFDGRININIRAVAGQKEENSEQTGYILVGSEPISDQFTLKIQ